MTMEFDSDKIDDVKGGRARKRDATPADTPSRQPSPAAGSAPRGQANPVRPRNRAGGRGNGGGAVGVALSPGRRARNALLPATLVGLLLGLVVAAAGFALISRQQPTYTATASLLVLPDQQARPDIVASLY